jgi:putative transposase
VGRRRYLHPAREGWLFVGSVLDVCARMVVGWSMADHLRTELFTGTLASGQPPGADGPSPITHAHSNSPVLRRPLEAAQYTSYALLKPWLV